MTRLISGWMPVDEFAEVTGIHLPNDHSYDTAAGFMLDRFGTLPSVGKVSMRMAGGSR